MMAKFVLAGRVDCPQYARAEMLAETLRAQLPDFHINKIVVSQDEWPSWVNETCSSNGWCHPYSSSPMIWRELIDRGGKGVYMGGLENFIKYTEHYYNIVPDTTNALDIEIAKENLDSYDTLKLEEAQNKPVDPLRVCITNASSYLAYHLASHIIQDNVFGDESIHLQLLDTNDNQDILHGLAMELQDLARPNLSLVTCTNSAQEAFKAVSAVFVLDEFKLDSENLLVTTNMTDSNEINESDRKKIFGTIDSVKNGIQDEEETKKTDGRTEDRVEIQDDKMLGLINDKEADQELIMAVDGTEQDQVVIGNESSQSAKMETDTTNEAVLREAAIKYDMYGGLLDYVAQKNVRVIIVGPFSNTGAALMAKRVSSIDRRNFISSSSLAESQATSVLAGKLNVATSNIHQVGIWGRSEGNILSDTSSTVVYRYQGSIVGPNSFSLGIKKCLFDYKWLTEDFPAIVVNRHSNSSYYGERGVHLAEAVSLGKLMKDWWAGVETWHSVGVVHQGEDIAVSCPCIGRSGHWEKIESATLEGGNNDKLTKIENELKKEFEKAVSLVENCSESAVTPTSKL